jgi:hypothetical protein
LNPLHTDTYLFKSIVILSSTYAYDFHVISITVDFPIKTFPGGKTQPRRDADRSFPSSAEVKNE